MQQLDEKIPEAETLSVVNDQDEEAIREKKSELKGLIAEVKDLKGQINTLSEVEVVTSGFAQFNAQMVTPAAITFQVKGEAGETDIAQALDEMIASLTNLKAELEERLEELQQLRDEKARFEREIQEKEEELETLKNELEEQRQKNEEAAQYVIGLIEALPENITYDDKAVIEEARKEYNALTRSQRKLIGEDCYSKLLQAEESLAEIPIPEVDKSQLQAKLAEAQRLDREDYTADTWAALQSAIAVAEYIITDDDATETSVANALGNLIAALEGLEVKEDPVGEEADNYRKAHSGALSLKVAEVTIADEQIIITALNAYDLLPKSVRAILATEKTLLDNLLAKVDELKQETAEQAAEEQANEFKQAHVDALDLTMDIVEIADQEKVDLALDAFNQLSEMAQAKLAIEKALLDDLQTRIMELKQEIVDQAAADEMVTLINELPDIEALVLEDREYVEAARAAYNNLTDVQKDLVSGDILEKLTALEVKIVSLQEQHEADQAAVESVINLIANLPLVEELTLESKSNVEAARNAYQNLDEELQDQVTNIDVLIKAENKIEELETDWEANEGANRFRDEVSTALSLAVETVGTDDRDIVEAALALYLNLPEQVKLKLVDEKALLDDLLAQIEQLEEANQEAADSVSKMVSSLPAIEDLTLDDKDAVEAARAAYDNLTERQLELLAQDSLDVLEAAEAKIKALEIEQVAEAEAQAFRETYAEALALEVNAVTIGDRQIVEDAMEAYDELSEATRAKLVNEMELLQNLLHKIVELEQQAAEDEAAARYVIGLIDALPSVADLALSDKKTVAAARDAYDELTNVQKELVTNLELLQAIEAQMAELEITVDLVGDEFLDGYYVVNQQYTDNTVKSDDIGTVRLWIGEKDVTDDFDITFFDAQDGNPLTTFDLSDGGTTFKTYMEAKCTSGEGYYDVAANVIFKYGSVTIGNNDTYYTIEDALDKAKSKDVVYVKYNTSFAEQEAAGFAYGGNNFTVSDGVTLLLPYSDALSKNIDDNPGRGNTGRAITRNSAYAELNIPSGIDLYVKGTLTINAMRAAYGTKYAGHVTTTNYSQLHLAENSKVVVDNGGTLSAMGFIYGEGQVEALPGSTVNDSLFLQSFRGGTATLNIQGEVFPFDQFTINNIETDLVINSGVSYYAKALIYVSSSYRPGDLKLVGADSKSLIQLKNGELIKTYDTGSGMVTMDFHGDASINVSSISVAGITANSTGKDMPFDGSWLFNFASGSNVDINSYMVLLPGGQMNIEEDASVTVTPKGRLGVFDPYEHLDDYNTYPAKCESYYRVAPKFDYDANTPGKLTVNGTLIVEGGLAGRVHVGDNGSIDTKTNAYTTYDYKYVIGSAGDAESASREITLWEKGDSTIAVVATPSTVVTKDKTVTTVVATVKDANNKPLQGIEVAFAGGKGDWSTTSGTSDANGRVTVTYTTSEDEEEGTLPLTVTATVDDKLLSTTANLEVKASSGGGSCPFVYSYDAETYHFEHEAIPFTVNKALEATSYAALQRLADVDGEYHVKIAETLEDKSFVRGFNLMAVDYLSNSGIEGVFPDIFGDVHTIKQRIAPTAFVDSGGRSLLDKVTTKGEIFGSDRSMLGQGEYVQSYRATFDRPENAIGTAKLMISLQSTEFARSCWHWFLDVMDGVNNTWWLEKALETQPLRDMFLDFISVVNVKVEQWNGNEWIEQGVIQPGLYLLEEFLVPLNLDLLDGEAKDVKVRISSGTGFYEIDQISIDYSLNESVSTQALTPVTALFNQTENVKSVIGDFDSAEWVRMLPGDEIDLVYSAPEIANGYKRDFIVAVKGYYHANYDSVENSIADEWDDLRLEEIIAEVLAVQPEMEEVIPALEQMIGLMESVYGESLETKMKQVIAAYVIPWLDSK